ncbi:MAG: 16S rRNA (cytosine(1402)-N(4))-methyltransferase, partial [Chitinophagaceae bacterium]|nr:16S rRNA (cytosine(1402)-N(4))-methyltransferase [Chitinophagaceae bacterium]
FIRNGAWQVIEDPLGLAPKTKVPLKEVTKKPIEATEEELKNNPRSRSARLRVAEKN